jgi:hypothetical protein
VSTIKSSAENLTLNADGANNDVIIQSNGSTKVTVDGQNSRVGIGTATPTTQLDVTSSGNGEIAIISGTSGITALYMGDSAQKDKGKIFYHNGSDYMAFNANGGEKLRIQTAGGISFNGDTAAANALDDYEEGTWTPVLSDGTNNATSGGTTGGVYTKIGRAVILNGYIITTSLGSVSGSLRITGMPFAVNNSNSNYGAASVAYGENFSITAGHTVSIKVNKNSSHVSLELWDSVQGVTPMQSGEWTSDGQLAFTLTYFVAV